MILSQSNGKCQSIVLFNVLSSFYRKKPAKTIFDIFDPFDLEQGHYTDQDQEIRNTDIPERMQLRQVGRV